jgi:hypothetical protein
MYLFRYSLTNVVLNLALKVHCRRERMEWEREGNQADAPFVIVAYVPT